MENRSITKRLLLLLYLAAKTGDKGRNILGHIKLQKLLYKTEERMIQVKCKGLNYNFIRWKFGPFSQENFNSDVSDLKESGFLIKKIFLLVYPIKIGDCLRR